MASLRLYAFGSPRLERDGQLIEQNLRKALALVIYLAVSGQTHRRDSLATLLWPEADRAGGRANLRRILYSLNQQLGDGILHITPESIAMDAQADLWLDTRAFSETLRGCLPAGSDPKTLSAECIEQLEAAAALCGEGFLQGFSLPDSTAFDEWQFFEAESLRQASAQLMEALAMACQASGRSDAAIQYARRWLALDGLHEPAHCLLMQLYAQAGQQAAALRQYEQCAQLLRQELGVEPESATTALYEAIRKGRLAPQPEEMHSHPETHYVSSGNVHIAYQVVGEGNVDIVVVPGFVSHLDLLWEEPGPGLFFRRLATFGRVILFDKRGMGLSDRVGYAPTLENTMDDILAVMEAAGSRSAVLMGVSEGGPNSALFAATYPDRVRGLVLYGTSARFTRAPDYPFAMPAPLWDRWMNQVIQDWGKPVSIEYFAPSRASEPGLRHWWAHFLRSASSPGTVRSALEVARDIDVRSVLPAIRAPTLVVHQQGDLMIRVGNARYLAEHIQDAKLVELAGDDHWWWVGEASVLLKQIELFLKTLEQPKNQASQPVITDRILASILYFEVLPGSDSQAGKAILTNVLEQFPASQLAGLNPFFSAGMQRAGEQCWMAVFDRPSRALSCARLALEAARQQNVAVRMGLHSGECELAESGVGGAAVAIAAGVVEHAAAGEVVVTSTVKELVVGAGFTFSERGVQRLGIEPGEWRLFTLQ